MCRSSFVVIRTAVIVAIVLVPRLSHADARQCEGAISAASAKFGRFYYQALIAPSHRSEEHTSELQSR